MIPKQRVLFFIGSDYSNVLCSLDWPLSDLYAVVPKEEPLFKQEITQKLSERFGDNLLSSRYDEKEIIEIIQGIRPQVIISMGWRRIFKEYFFLHSKDILKINIHPALLPSYKGYHTEPYVIMNNEKCHGISAHVMTEKLDAGDIIQQTAFAINEFSTVKSIKDQVLTLMPLFVNELLRKVATGQYVLKGQDPTQTRIVAPKRTPMDSELDPSLPLTELYHRIRACDPEQFPAFFYLGKQKVYIKVWRDNDAVRKNQYEI